jgi:phage terminase large subunit-like protein
VEWEWDKKTDPLSCYYKLMVIDPAVTEHTKADDTAIAVFGVDAEDEIHLLELFAEKIDPIDLEGIIFAMKKEWQPEEIVMEKGLIKSAILPFMEREMQRRNDWFDIEGIHAHGDKGVRAKPIQARLKFQKIYVNSKIDPKTKSKMYKQLSNFPKYKHDDIVDVFAYFGIRQNELIQGRTKAEVEEFEFNKAVSIFEELYGDFEADPDTGY